MSTHSSLNRESFKKLLASVFSMQDSVVDAHSLAALLALEKSIATANPTWIAPCIWWPTMRETSPTPLESPSLCDEEIN